MKITTRIVVSAALSLVFAAVSTAGLCAVKKPAAKKPAAKKPAAQKPAPTRTVLGTTQLSGEQAQLGVTYTLGKEEPINVTLDKVEYTVEPVRFGNTYTVTNADQKLLVLHYTLHNCNPKPRGLAWSTLNITAVDAKDTNWRYVQDVAMETTGENCSMTLKPAQKTKVYTAIVVPAKGEIPKVMIESHDKLVLRYDIRGKAVKLPDPIADPSDPTGATAREKVPAQIGTYYPLKELHAKIDNIGFSTEPVQGLDLGQGNRYLVVKGTAKNNQIIDQGFAWSTIQPKLIDADGAQINWNQNTYYASRDDLIGTNIQPGQELRFRWVFEVPEKLPLQSLSVYQHEGREYIYDLSNLQ